MPNTNFQTFHQMGQAINEVVRQATGRDAVQNIDMDHVTVAQNHYYEEMTASGSLVSFPDRVGNTPLEKCVVQIEPVQAGSGDPSPSNVRQITGWTGVNIYVSPTTNAQDGTTYSIPFPAEAGTVYGGTLDVLNGVLTLDRASILVRDAPITKSSTNFSTWRIKPAVEPTPVVNRDAVLVISSIYKGLSYNGATTSGDNYVFLADAGRISIKHTATSGLTVEEYKSQYGDVRFVYYIATPLTYQLTPTEIRTLLGQNHIWADTGNITVKFKVLKELY